MNKKLLAILLFSFIFLNIEINTALGAGFCEPCDTNLDCDAGLECRGDPNPTDGMLEGRCYRICPAGAICIDNPLNACSIEDLINAIVNLIFWFGMALAPLMIIIAGFFFLTAGGEPDKIKKAKNIITWTFVGLLIILLAKGLISALKTVLGG